MALKHKYNTQTGVLCTPNESGRNAVDFINPRDYSNIVLTPIEGDNLLFKLELFRITWYGTKRLVQVYDKVGVFEGLELDSNLGMTNYNPFL